MCPCNIGPEAQFRPIHPWRQYARTHCCCAATHPFLDVFVCFACADAHAKHTKTSITTWGRRRRPACPGILPIQHSHANGRVDLPEKTTGHGSYQLSTGKTILACQYLPCRV